MTIRPDSDGIFRVKIYSGYPLFQNDKEYNTPLYAQGYTWSKNYGLLIVDVNNCLKVRREF